MAKLLRTGEVAGKSANLVYEASIKAFEGSGFEVWKKRPLAWLSLARQNVEGIEISANLAARPTIPVSYSLTMVAEGFSEEKLNPIAEHFLKLLQDALSQ